MSDRPGTLLALDLADPGAAARLPIDVEAVVACQAARGDRADAYRRAYVDANRVLLARYAPRPLRAFVYTSSTGVFGQDDGAEVDESSPVTPASPTAEVLVEAERLVLSAASQGCATRVLRLSGLYGPGRTGIVERVRSGALALGPGDDTWMNLCHRDDAVGLVLAALDQGRDGAVYHGSDAEPARRRDVVTWIADRLRIAPPRSGGPEGAGRRGPNRRVSSARTRAALGHALRWPSFRDGLAPLLPR